VGQLNDGTLPGRIETLFQREMWSIEGGSPTKRRRMPSERGSSSGENRKSQLKSKMERMMECLLFVTALKLALESETGNCVKFYINDVLLFSRTFKKHLRHLDILINKRGQVLL
jgi:hypothetical protein